MKIEIWSDFACPFCYIGKKRFENALAKFAHKEQVEVIYKAYQLNPNAPKKMSGSAYESFAKGHGMSVEQAKQRFKMFTENAKTVGLVYDYDHIQMTNTFDAHRLAKWANTFAEEAKLTDRFMKAYFTEGKNLADYSTLLDLVAELGLNVTEAKTVLESGKYSLEVRGQIDEARQIGVQGVPFFVINRKYGVSGAQAEETFAQALAQIYQEEQPLQTLAQDDAGLCNDEHCEIPHKK